MNAPQFEDHAPESQYQATQVISQPDLPSGTTIFDPVDPGVYAYFQPCAAPGGAGGAVSRMNLIRPQRTYTVGRGPHNDFRLTGMKISFSHCRIEWDQSENKDPGITIHDSSTNGTWVNGARIGRGRAQVIRDGNEVAFGTPTEGANRSEDYRYIFRVFTGDRRERGINASYDLVHELGKGAFATVMKALHRQSGQFYAVKIIHGSKVSGNDKERFDKLMREIKILEALDHPNICSLKEMFHEDGDENIFVVLELVEGGDMLDYIAMSNGLDEDMSKHIAKQICHALAYIHEKGVTHRDLKPENILLTKDDPPVAKIADFGLAKLVDHLTMLRTLCGTPNYLAPEVVNPHLGTGYDQKVDAFSVGVIVFSMLTNCGPFVGGDDEDIPIHLRISQRQVSWDILNEKGVSPACIDFIKQLMQEHPLARMSVTDALQHPWITGEELDQVPVEYSQQSTSSFPPLSQDVSMASEASMGPPPVPPPASQGPRLQRRSDILARAAEAQMTATGNSSADSDNPSETNGKRPRSNGNLAAPMEIIAESGELGEEPSAKRGRHMEVDENDETAVAPARGKRGARNGDAAKPTPPVRVTRAAAAAQEEVRRSPRTAGRVKR